MSAFFYTFTYFKYIANKYLWVKFNSQANLASLSYIETSLLFILIHLAVEYIWSCDFATKYLDIVP